MSACEGDTGPAGPGPPILPTATEYMETEEAPTLSATVLEVLGASNGDGSFEPGDILSVRFSVKKEDDSNWRLDELVSGQVLVSGPTFNYQRVLPMTDDVLARAEADGPDSYRLAVGVLPDRYAAPYNDSDSFGEGDGERTGEALDPGTYTVGLSFAWEYRVGERTFQRIGEDTFDFRIGAGAGPLAPREVTQQANCASCHIDLSAHEGRYTNVSLCMLCHTSGAEDSNDPAIAGGTPGVSIDSRVLFHKIHAGRSLPTTLGIGVNATGRRIYTPEPVALRYVGSDGAIHDFTDVGFPVLPNRDTPMPRDTGYNNLSESAQAKEDANRRGPATCSACHGDPDGDGPAAAPAQGQISVAQPSRRACGACHDDVQWDRPYRANGQMMPPQANDSGCISCHQIQTPDNLNPIVAHRHPLDDPNRFNGLHWLVEEVQEAGAHDADGTLDPGEKVLVRATLRDDDDMEFEADNLDSVRITISGPTTNPQLLHDFELPGEALVGMQPYNFFVPTFEGLELVGHSSTASSEEFQTALRPHRQSLGTDTVVQVRSGTGAASVLTEDAQRFQNYIDVASGALFARDDVVLIDDGTAVEEVRRVQFVDGDRLWFSAPNRPDYPASLRANHDAGADVQVLQLTTLVEGTDYSYVPALGRIAELTEFGVGSEVLVSYVSDFVLPTHYPQALNGSPDLGGDVAKWTGLELVDGTYTLRVQGHTSFNFTIATTRTPYLGGSDGGTFNFPVGASTAITPYDLISDPGNCLSCHKQLTFHGGRDRGFDSCITCHGTAGSEDLPRYAAANAPETSGVTVQFRSLLHRIHRGRDVGDPDFMVVAEGSDDYPDNFHTRAFSDFGFPARPEGTKNCSACHGDVATEVFYPRDRDHPQGQTPTALEWTLSCGACHGDPAAVAHMSSNTAPSGEACAICHGPGEEEDVLRVHRIRRSF